MPQGHQETEDKRGGRGQWQGRGGRREGTRGQSSEGHPGEGGRSEQCGQETGRHMPGCSCSLPRLSGRPRGPQSYHRKLARDPSKGHPPVHFIPAHVHPYPFYPLHASLFLRSSRFAHPPPAERKHQEGRNRHLFPPLTDPWAPGTEPHRWGTLLKRNHQMPKWWMNGAKAHGALLTSTAPAAQGKRNAWT